jgi:glycosyltransferase involved in cell wall biosynthesis
MPSSRRRVLFLIPSLAGGGAERVIVTLLRHLDRSQFKLALAVVDMRGAVFRDDVPEDVEIIELQCPRVRYALPKIIRLIWQRRPDVLFSTLGHLNLALAVLRPLLPNNIRYLARETIVVSEGLKSYAHPTWWAWAYRQFYGRFDRVICQSQDMRDDLVEYFSFDSDKSVIINNPVDVERIRRQAAEPVDTGFHRHDSSETGRRVTNLVSVGRLVPQKGFDLLIEALALCGNPCLHLTLLGEGPMREELETLAQSKGVGGQIRFAGFQKNPYPFFSQADAFVLSSRFEGFPNVVLEALACGTPVIATPALGGTKEILQGVPSCLMAGSLTAKSLAEALTSFTPGERLPMAVVEPYSVGKIVERYAMELMGDTAI